MFQYEGKPRKKLSAVFAATCEKPYALANTGRTVQPQCGSKPVATRKTSGTIT